MPRVRSRFKPFKLSKENKKHRAAQEAARAALTWRPSLGNNFLLARPVRATRRAEAQAYLRLLKYDLFVKRRAFVAAALKRLELHSPKGQPISNSVINNWAHYHQKETARRFKLKLPKLNEIYQILPSFRDLVKGLA